MYDFVLPMPTWHSGIHFCCNHGTADRMWIVAEVNEYELCLMSIDYSLPDSGPSYLEYADAGPSNRKDQKRVEKARRRSTRLVSSVRSVRASVRARLQSLNLLSLFYRRRQGNMIIITGYQVFQGELLHGSPSTGSVSPPQSYCSLRKRRAPAI